jgi:hypothetical protein
LLLLLQWTLPQGKATSSLHPNSNKTSFMGSGIQKMHQDQLGRVAAADLRKRADGSSGHEVVEGWVPPPVCVHTVDKHSHAPVHHAEVTIG